LSLPPGFALFAFRSGDGSGERHVLTTDEEAEFTVLVERQSRFVFRVAYAVLLNSHDAEDAVQETFLKLYRNGGWQHVGNERAFLARVAWRVAVDRRRSSNPSAPAGESEVELPSLNPGPEQTLVAANQHALVHSMIDALPDELRLPLVLSAADELNSREIAAVLGIPEGTVRTRLQRALQVLRQRLANLNTRNQETHYA
jgi:RNA polymerase sigma-70 factor (ECF subfamily)